MLEKIIMGKINSGNVIGFWKAGENLTPDVIAGDYAIAENKTDYDLIKIIGILETDEKYEKFIAPGGIAKKAIYYIAKCQVNKNYGSRVIIDNANITMGGAEMKASNVTIAKEENYHETTN